MKIRYLILLSAILFVIGCAQQPTLPTETTPTETIPAPTETIEPIPIVSDVIIKERIVTPTELTIPAGTEVSISVEGKTAHVILIDKEVSTIANLGTFTDGGKVTYTFDEAGSYTIRSLKVGSVRVAVTVE